MFSHNLVLLSVTSLLFFHLDVVVGDKCCCCELSDYYEVSRVWTKSDECESPKICCNIPSQYECELDLNPTFDGSCGHVDESSYQSKNGGPSPVVIPRNGYSSNFDIKGWFGQRLMDENGNEIQEWCFDNGENDSFFLFRYVPCNGDYPNWFGRCVFPSANNALIYAECDNDDHTKDGCDYSEFSSTIPSCFGEIEHINIGYGSDYGRQLDYRLLPMQEHEWIWCTKNGKPYNPPSSKKNKTLMYDGDALNKGDGITPFYLEECREVINVNAVSMAAAPLTVNYANYGNNSSNTVENINEMKPLSFGVSIILENDEIMEPNSMRTYSFAIESNDIAYYYNSKLKTGDSWSLALKDLSLDSIAKVVVPGHWNYTMKSKSNGVFITYINENVNDIDLITKQQIAGFKVITQNNAVITTASWIARSLERKGSFMGFGKVKL